MGMGEKSEINVCRANENYKHETVQNRVSIVVKLMDASAEEED